jgi:cyanophycinase
LTRGPFTDTVANLMQQPQALPSRLAIVAALVVALPALATERLVLVGGGDLPARAKERFVEWSGGPSARVLVILWATSEPKENLEWIREELSPLHPASLEAAPLAPLQPATRAQLLTQLGQASGVFFTGGDQARIMDVLKDAEVLAAFRERFHAGVVFGGTSAGCAAMSSPMITGEGDFTVVDGTQVDTREGLGLLPGVILDQHFLKRQRENRLFGLVLAHPSALGVGIDEATALMVEDGTRGEVAGKGQVMLVDGQREPGALLVRLFSDGARIDLTTRRGE